jgi:ribosomal protein S20
LKKRDERLRDRNAEGEKERAKNQFHLEGLLTAQCGKDTNRIAGEMRVDIVAVAASIAPLFHRGTNKMPTLKSGLKRMQTSEKSRIKTVRGKLFAAVAAKDKAAGEKAYREYCSLLDKSAKKGVIPQNTATRRKARAANMTRAL